MKRKALGRDVGLTLRTAFVAMLLVAMSVLVLYGYWRVAQYHWTLWIALPAFVFAGGAAVAGSGGTLPRDRRARRLKRGEVEELQARVARLASFADLPTPRVEVIRTPVPNAFTLGWTREDATITVTTGLLDRLDDEELEAVLAHEVAHVAHHDVAVVSAASFVQQVGAGIFYGLPLLAPIGAVVYSIGTLLVVSLSRYREYAADRGSVLLTGAPEQLMSALQTIADELAEIPRKDLREVAGLDAVCILPVSGPRWFELASTHPPLEKRLEQLAELARDMGKVD